MTYQEYSALPGVRVSELRLIQRAPALYRYHRDNPSEQTPAMRLGSLVHMAILEPQRFELETFRLPHGLDRRTKEGRETYARLIAEHPLATEISADHYEAIMGMRDAVMSHPGARLLIGAGEHEIARQWEVRGQDAKGRADVFGRTYLADLKKTRCASPEAFAKSVLNYDYDMQAAWYLDGWQVEKFYHIAVEDKAPYLVAVYELDAAAIERGRQRCMDALELFRICQETGNWPGYSSDVETLSLPAWAFDHSDDEEAEDEQ